VINSPRPRDAGAALYPGGALQLLACTTRIAVMRGGCSIKTNTSRKPKSVTVE